MVRNKKRKSEHQCTSAKTKESGGRFLLLRHFRGPTMRSLLLLAVSPSVALFDTFWMEEPQEQLYSLNGAPIPDYGGDPSWLEWEDGPVRLPARPQRTFIQRPVRFSDQSEHATITLIDFRRAERTQYPRRNLHMTTSNTTCTRRTRRRNLTMATLPSSVTSGGLPSRSGRQKNFGRAFIPS